VADGIVGNGYLVAGGFGPGVTVSIVNGVASLSGGTPTDPAGTITIVVTDPSPTPVVTTYTYPASMTKVSVGLYTVLVPCTVAGTWEAVVAASPPSTGYGAAKTEWTVAPT
jgi:hypothetical protein